MSPNLKSLTGDTMGEYSGGVTRSLDSGSNVVSAEFYLSPEAQQTH